MAYSVEIGEMSMTGSGTLWHFTAPLIIKDDKGIEVDRKSHSVEGNTSEPGCEEQVKLAFIEAGNAYLAKYTAEATVKDGFASLRGDIATELSKLAVSEV